MRDYIPEFDPSNCTGRFEIPLTHCPTCRALMVDRRLKPVLADQLIRVGWRVATQFRDMSFEPVCEECVVRGKVTFVCALCNQERSSYLVKESVGEPPERLCRICWETVPAKTWEERLEKLHENHRYDFE